MPSWRTLIEKDYLGSWDLVDKAGNPKDYTLEIEKVSSMSLKTKETPKGKRKCVIRFKGAQKGFVANSTNCETISSMYGTEDVSKWVGCKITLYATDVRMGPKMVKGIRVRPRKPQGPAEVVESQPVDRDVRDAQDEALGREPGEEG